MYHHLRLLLQIELHTLPIHSVSSSNLEHEKLSKAFAYVKHGGCHGAIHFHASPQCIKSLQVPMYTKFITQVYNVTLNTSMHQYCVISIAPPTGHKNSAASGSAIFPGLTGPDIMILKRHWCKCKTKWIVSYKITVLVKMMQLNTVQAIRILNLNKSFFPPEQKFHLVNKDITS